MKLVDTNVLLHAVNGQAAQHAEARAWIESSLARSEGVAFTWLALVGFVRIATHPSVLTHPLTSADALLAVDEWLRHPHARVLQPGPRHQAVLGDLLAASGGRGNLVNDAHIAAVAIEHGATVASFDGDFRRFPGLLFEWLGRAH